MTIQNQNAKNVYSGNGSTTVFPYTFAMNNNHPEYIHVYITGEDGVARETTDFSVDVKDCHVVYPKPTSTAPALASGQKITLMREVPLQQLLALFNQGPFFSENIEQQLDEMEMQIQQLREAGERSLKTSVESTNFNAAIPLKPGKSFRINQEGTGFEVTEDPAVAMQSAQISATLATSAKQAAEEAQAAAEQSAAIAVTAAIKNYDNVAAMKADTHVFAGAKAITSGYYSANDGGGASYILRERINTDTEDGKYIIFLQNNKVAEWISEDIYRPYKKDNYSETHNYPALKSHNQAIAEWEQRKILDTVEGTLTVATFNILNTFDFAAYRSVAYLPFSKKMTAILMTKAEVVGYNEIRNNLGYNAVQLYSNDNRYIDGIFAVARQNSGYGFDYGDLIETAYPTSEKTAGLLSHADGYEDRSYARVMINIKGKNVSIYSTHLEHGASAQSKELRKAQIAELFNILESDPAPYRIVMGDLNTPIASDFAPFTNAGYKLVNTGQYNTYANISPIDNIIVSPNISILESGMVDVYSVPPSQFAVTVSDHNPLFARLRFD